MLRIQCLCGSAPLVAEHWTVWTCAACQRQFTMRRSEGAEGQPRLDVLYPPVLPPDLEVRVIA